MVWCWGEPGMVNVEDLRALDAMVMRQSVKGWQFLAADLQGAAVELVLRRARDGPVGAAQLQVAAQLWVDVGTQGWELGRIELSGGGMTVLLRRAKAEYGTEGGGSAS